MTWKKNKLRNINKNRHMSVSLLWPFSWIRAMATNIQMQQWFKSIVSLSSIIFSQWPFSYYQHPLNDQVHWMSACLFSSHILGSLSKVGEQVEYWSASSHRWMPAIVAWKQFVANSALRDPHKVVITTETPLIILQLLAKKRWENAVFLHSPPFSFYTAHLSLLVHFILFQFEIRIQTLK